MKYFLLILLFLTLSDAKEATVTQLFNAQTVKVAQFPHGKSLKSYGYVKADEARVFDVAPRFGGFVEVLYADRIYKEIQKGEILAKVYSPEVLKAKDDYLSTINYTKHNQNKAMLESAKIKLQLLNIPHAEIESIQKEQKTTNFTDILSPSEGYVFAKELHNQSAFSAKQKIFTIINLDTVWVEVKIHQDQLKDLDKFNNFTLSTPAYSQTFEAKKIQLYPQIAQNEEAFTLRLEVQNKEHLLIPGMYANVEMSAKEQTLLTLPTTAVIRKNGKFYVFGVGEYEGEYEPKEVEVEVLNPDTYIVKSGLNEGDEVVNNALFMMDSDAQINGLY